MRKHSTVIEKLEAGRVSWPLHFSILHQYKYALQIFLLPNLSVNFMLALLDADIAFVLNLSASSFTLTKSFIHHIKSNDGY